MSTLTKKAKDMYTAYCEGVGGVAYNGDKLPDADTLFADPTKEKVVNGWLKAAGECRYGVKSPSEFIDAKKEGDSELSSTVSAIVDASVNKDYFELSELSALLQVASLKMAMLEGLVSVDEE